MKSVSYHLIFLSVCLSFLMAFIFSSSLINSWISHHITLAFPKSPGLFINHGKFTECASENEQQEEPVYSGLAAAQSELSQLRNAAVEDRCPQSLKEAVLQD